MPTVEEIQNMSEQDVNRLIGKTIMKHVAFKVGIAVAIHVAVRQIVKNLED